MATLSITATDHIFSEMASSVLGMAVATPSASTTSSRRAKIRARQWAMSSGAAMAACGAGGRGQGAGRGGCDEGGGHEEWGVHGEHGRFGRRRRRDGHGGHDGRRAGNAAPAQASLKKDITDCSCSAWPLISSAVAASCSELEAFSWVVWLSWLMAMLMAGAGRLFLRRGGDFLHQ